MKTELIRENEEFQHLLKLFIHLDSQFYQNF